MIISFDIDNTLIPYSDEFEVEEMSFFSKIVGAESIRKGTIELFTELENRGHQIWIYTTSFRSQFNLKKTFKSYGLKPSKIINEKTNQEKLKSNNCKASKNPKLFGIDIHVDDSEGVVMEGEKYGFKTILITPDDKDWVKKIKTKVEVIEINLDWQYEQLLITLIALKSKPKRQREIYGYGHTEDEMVNDFDSYYTLIRKKLIEHKYIKTSIDEKLLKLDKFITSKSEKEDKDFWEELEIHQDWEIIRGMAKEILEVMGKGNLEIKVNHHNEYDKEGNITMQRTELKIIQR